MKMKVVIISAAMLYSVNLYANETITACYHKNTGAMRVVASSEGCLPSDEDALVWNIQGLKGDKGDTGLTGLQGIQGSKGDTGNTGAKGDTGNMGLQGMQGLAGSQGATGTQGLTGSKGESGSDGATGPQGPIGLTGADGVDADTSALEARIVELEGQLNNYQNRYIVGDTGPAGGIVFYVDSSGKHGLEATLTPLTTRYGWGCSGTELSGARSYKINTGEQNTIEILAECTDTNGAASVAAHYISGGFDDWYLPSVAEAHTLIEAVWSNVGISPIYDVWIWTSTQGHYRDLNGFGYMAWYANIANIHDAEILGSKKDNVSRAVWPIRTF